MAHLDPVLQHFDVRAVAIASMPRWKAFRRATEGNPNPCPRNANLVKNIKDAISYRRNKARIRATLLRYRKAPLLVADDVNSSEFLRTLTKFPADIYVTAAYPQIFHNDFLLQPSGGVINFHPSRLPRCRGAHPHYWSIANGEELGGVTAHYAIEQLDAGNILAQISFPISHYNYTQLYNKVISETPTLVENLRVALETDEDGTPQIDDDSTLFRQDREIHHRVPWQYFSMRDVHNLIRTERAYCYFRNKRVRICASTMEYVNRNMTNHCKMEAGTIVDITENSLVVAVGEGFLRLDGFGNRHKTISGSAWIAKVRPEIGERFN